MSKITILLIGILVLNLSESKACSCEDPGSVAAAFNYTETIIHGKVIKKTFVSLESTMNSKKLNSIKSELKGDNQKLGLLQSEFVIELQIEILKVFKGELIGDTITLYTSRTSASCGFTRFKEGQDFLIYASSKSHISWLFNSVVNLEEAHTFWTNHCTRTKEYSLNEAMELEALMKR